MAFVPVRERDNNFGPKARVTHLREKNGSIVCSRREKCGEGHAPRLSGFTVASGGENSSQIRRRLSLTERGGLVGEAREHARRKMAEVVGDDARVSWNWQGRSPFGMRPSRRR
ncbi:hypothetical protein MRX96_036759 [Rhipicephalus microplus]